MGRWWWLIAGLPLLLAARGWQVHGGHDTWVTSVAYSPDGRLLASAGDGADDQVEGGDGPVKLWDARTGALLTALDRGSHDRLVAFSPDGRRLASAGSDGTVKLWHPDQGNLIRTCKAAATGTEAIAFSPDGRLLAAAAGRAADQDPRYQTDRGPGLGQPVPWRTFPVTVWDAATCRLRYVIAAHPYGVRALAFSPDSRLLASGGADGTARLWDTGSGKLHAVLRGHGAPVSALAFHPAGGILATASWDRQIRLWNSRTGKLVVAYPAHDSLIHALVYARDGRLASASGAFNPAIYMSGAGSIVHLPPQQDTSIKVWDGRSARLLAKLAGHPRTVNALAFSPDGRTLASAGSDRAIKLWALAAGRPARTLAGRLCAPLALAVDSRRRTLALGLRDHTVRLWDMVGNQPPLTLIGHRQRVTAVAFSPDGLTLASAGNDSTVRLWDARRHSPRASLSGHALGVTSLAYRPDGLQLASAGWDGTVRLWDPVGGNAAIVLGDGSRSALLSLAYSPDGHWLAAGDWGHAIHVWDVAGHRLHLHWEAHARQVTAIAYSPDGRVLVSGSTDRTVKVWNPTTAGLLKELSIPGAATALAISADSRFLAAGTGDGRILIWTLPDGRLLVTLSGHDQGITSLAFTPGDGQLVSAGKDGGIKFWHPPDPNAVTFHLFETGNWVASRSGRILYATPGSLAMVSRPAGTPQRGWEPYTSGASSSPQRRSLASLVQR